MRSLTMVVELTFDEEIHGTDIDSANFFYYQVLKDADEQGIILHSNMIGDEIGKIKVLEIFA